MALLLSFAPGALHQLEFAFPAEFDWWDRVLGTADIQSRPVLYRLRLGEIVMLIKLTIATRTLVIAAVAALVMLHVAPPLALGVGVIDIASAALTAWAISTETQSRTA